MILRDRVPWKLSVRALLVIGLLALVALPGWSLGQVATTAPKQDPAPKADPSVAAIELLVEAAVTLDPAPVQVRAEGSPNPITDAAPAYGIETPVLVQAAGDDSRIDALEKKLDAIIAEVRALRAGRNAPAATSATTVAVPTLWEIASATAQTAPASALSLTRTGRVDWVPRLEKGSTDSDVQMLSRGTYAMPKPKAEALAAFLREHMKATVEVGVKDDDGKTSLIVTASPEVQAVIGQFIALSEGRQPPAATRRYQVSPPQPNVNHYKAQPQKATPALLPDPVPHGPAAPTAVPPAKP